MVAAQPRSRIAATANSRPWENALHVEIDRSLLRQITPSPFAEFRCGVRATTPASRAAGGPQPLLQHLVDARSPDRRAPPPLDRSRAAADRNHPRRRRAVSLHGRLSAPNSRAPPDLA